MSDFGKTLVCALGLVVPAVALLSPIRSTTAEEIATPSIPVAAEAESSPATVTEALFEWEPRAAILGNTPQSSEEALLTPEEERRLSPENAAVVMRHRMKDRFAKAADEAAVERVAASHADVAARSEDCGASMGLAEAKAWRRLKRNDRARLVLERLARCPESARAAYVAMAQVNEAEGASDETLIENLETALRAAPAPRFSPLSDDDSSADIAQPWLAGLYERRGDLRRAVEMLEAWVPNTWCGNAAELYYVSPRRGACPRAVRPGRAAGGA